MANYTSIHTGLQIDEAVSKVNNGELQDKLKTATAVLAVSGWDENSQTVSVADVTDTNSVIIAPAPASMEAYAAAGIICTEQSAGSLTFTCASAPTDEITVNVIVAD